MAQLLVLYILCVFSFIPQIYSHHSHHAGPVIPKVELGTGLKIDITSHRHYHYLPSIYDCGISYAFLENHKSKRYKRVVGGKPLTKGRSPWMVQLYLHNISSGVSEFHCAGSLITRNVILTAAHCVTRITSGTSLNAVMLGEVDRRNVRICETETERNCTREKQREIIEVIIHEHYSEANLQNDIALIKLSGDLEFNSTTRPVCLPYTEELLKQWKTPNTDLIAEGWGTQNKFDDPGPKKLSNVLEEVKIPLRKRKYCDKFHSRLYGTLLPNRFCAGGGEAGKDTCSGDSGGAVTHPLLLNGQEKYFQFGIVSSGHVSTCGWQGRPSIYTNVLYFMPWIMDHLGHRPSLDVTLNPIYTDRERHYNNEMSTGLDIDERMNPLSALLPDYHRCGYWMNTKRTDIPQTGTQAPNLGSHTDNSEEDDLQRSKRIIGGRSTGGIVSFPWMAQIYVRDSMTNKVFLRCGGSIINSRHILTSATCLTEIGGEFTLDSVTLGNYNRNATEECSDNGKPKCAKPFQPEIQEIIIHKKYVKFTHQNDIALIRVADDIKYNDYIQPICLPLYEKITENWPNYRFTSAGWGRVVPEPVENLSSSNLLHSVQVNLIDRKECDDVFTRLWGNLERARICAGGAPGKGECKGDLGSPLMKSIGSRRNVYQFGILSFTECAQQGVPSIYTNLIYHIPWIISHLA